ncbi:hyaluronidase PH-20-like [Erinaceus europaeus]|uniref:Hyaluronidase n=1 Tax=Erinaceus europaeus TaxID=9365 RepID=A0A1S3A9Y7_ERIEU|nr:hyaluronidase PH-20-like [Erinaceus europaeus]
MEVLKFFMPFVGLSGTWQAILIILLFPMCLTQNLRAHPIFPNVPYLWVWNAPTEYCTKNHKVPLDLSVFSLVGSPQKNIKGQSIRIFYSDRLGKYPYVDSDNVTWHGGIPQAVKLQEHLEQAKKDIVHYLPNNDIGLAIIDWQEWRPLWIRNWDHKDIYRQMSIQSVHRKSPSLDATTVNNTAKADFENAAKQFLLETLKLGKLLRPKRYWGYYLFPDCYNHHYTNAGYDGRCFDIEVKRNDELSWLWNESTALYPSIYLNTKLKSSRLGTLFSRNRIQEAIRVSKSQNAMNPLPVFVYTRPVFTDASWNFLSEFDLVSTIGESVSLGASGNILWGSLNFSQSKESCTTLDNYMKTILVPYIINVSLAAKMCSQVLCYSQGLCARKNWDSDHYLHLNASNFYIEYGHCKTFAVTGEPTLADLYYFIDKFDCSCFSNVTCKMRKKLENLDVINVCIGENICIGTQIKEKLARNRSKWKERFYKSFNNVSSSVSPAKMSPCASGKDISECLKVRCSVEAVSNNAQEGCQNVNWINTSNQLYIQNEENEADSSTSSILLIFPVNILFVLYLFYKRETDVFVKQGKKKNT